MPLPHVKPSPPKVVVIGLGRFGSSLALQLHDGGAEVVAMDPDGQRVAAIRDRVTVAIQVDASRENELRAHDVPGMDVGVVAIGTHFESAVLITDLLKKLGVPRVIARVTSPERGRILRLVGADELVSPEEEAARGTTGRILRPALSDYLRLTASRSVVELTVPAHFVGKTLKELDLRRRFHVTILGIKHRMEVLDEVGDIGAPNPDVPLRVGDLLIAVGFDSDLVEFVRVAERP